MEMQKIIIENFKSIECYEVETTGKIFLIHSKDEENIYSFLDAIRWGLNVHFEFGSFINLLNENCCNKLLMEESQLEQVKVSIIINDDSQEICLTKVAKFILKEYSIELKEINFYIDQNQVEFTLFGELCAKYYNYCFKYLSFILNEEVSADFDSMRLFIDRMINLQGFCDVEKERECINKVAKQFKINSKQLHLEINEDLIPHWYRSKSGIYLGGRYSESEDVLRKAYYLLTLNRYVSKKENRNLPIFVDARKNRL